jgi:hypothetical protein
VQFSLRGSARRVRRSFFPPSEALGDLAIRVGALETAIGYLIDPARFTDSQGDGGMQFNGQRCRALLFNALLDVFQCESIIETGTYLGNTTRYMADTSSVPVYSCEINPAFFAIANKELTGTEAVNLFFGDSRAFLDDLVSRRVHQKPSLFYLDAHWNHDLPLMGEIEIIMRNWDEFVLMIDDFQVPHDDGYGFDDYGPGKRFTLRDFKPAFESSGLVTFFPNAPSAEETGHRRGCVILTKRGKLSAMVSQVDSLTQQD